MELTQTTVEELMDISTKIQRAFDMAIIALVSGTNIDVKDVMLVPCEERLLLKSCAMNPTDKKWTIINLIEWSPHGFADHGLLPGHPDCNIKEFLESLNATCMGTDIEEYFMG